MDSNLGNLIRKRALVAQIVWFRMKSTAVDNRLGVLWWLVDPLLMVLIYWFIFSVVRGAHRYQPYPIFLGCAIVSWRFFARCLNTGTNTFRRHGSTMKAIPFPTMALPIALVIEECLLFCFGLSALVLVGVFLDCRPTLFLLQVIPLIIIQATFTLGVTLIAACLGVLIYDLNQYMTHAIRMCFYLSPAIYGLDMLKKYLVGLPQVFDLYFFINPFAMYFTAYRMSIWKPEMIPLWWYGFLAGEALLVATAGFSLYRRLDRRLLKSVV